MKDVESDCLARICIIGRVQGVGYRYSAFRMANSLNLNGYVKNLPDDSVYIEAEGSSQSVKTLIEWCWKGPSQAIVESVEYSLYPVLGYRNFQIR